MDIKIKAGLCVLPVLGTIGIVLSLVMPALDDFNAKGKALDEKKSEQKELDTKLRERAKVLREKSELETAITQLRDAVPKRPEVEILNLDMEKMCLDSGVELVGVKVADQESLKRAGLAEPEKKATDAAKKAASTAGAAASGQGGTSGAKKPAAASGGAAGPDSGLAKLTLQVKCIGDYAGIQKLISQLETYRRVLAISEVKTSIPKKEDSKKANVELQDETTPAEGDDQGDYRRLNCSLLVTAYYLP